MFFTLSKILGFFALPSNLLVSAGLAGVLTLALGWNRTGTTLLVASVLLLTVAGLSPLGNALILPLEDRFPPSDPADPRPVSGIVVLGGSFDTLVSPARGQVSLNEAAERLTVVAELARRHPQARVVFSGGSGRLFYEDATEAEIAARMLESFGIAPERVVLEDRSRNTRENALFSKEAAAPAQGERWLLVTSAYHMPRAVGCFRVAGFAVEAHPVDYRTRGRADLARPFGSLGEGLRRVDIAIREWMGLAVYRASGYTDAVVPAP